jgi:SOS-response transcriptional repressor LexA
MPDLTPIAAYLEGQRHLREIEGRTAFARFLGVDQSLYTRWIDDGVVPGSRNLAKAAAALGVEHGELMRIAGHVVVTVQAGDPVPHLGDWAADTRRGNEFMEALDLSRFSARIVGDCMGPQYPAGMVLIFDRERPAVVGSIVAAVVAGERHIKRVVSRNGAWVLADAHGNQIIADRSEITIWGVMVDD